MQKWAALLNSRSPSCARLATTNLPPSFSFAIQSVRCLAAMGTNGGQASEEARKKAAIYTRTGDSGTSSLYSGERREKDAEVFEALGDVDELNSAVGVAREYCIDGDDDTLSGELSEIQSRLLDVGSAVATPVSTSPTSKLQRTRFDDAHVAVVEAWIDALDAKLPRLTNFILPSGGKGSAHLHVCRGICRRAERRVVPLVRQQQVEPAIGKYLNRLSDYFFTAARFAAMQAGQPEVIYQKARTDA
eukprot:jgi/Chlat1/3830/Chrsp26S08838